MGEFWVGVKSASLQKLILLIYLDPKPPQPLPNTAHPIPAQLPEEKVQPRAPVTSDGLTLSSK